MTNDTGEHLTAAEALIKKAEDKVISLRNRANAAAREIAPALDQDVFKAFLKEPYVLIEKKKDEWYCIVPRFVDFSVGWLEFATDSFNVFLVNRYTLWIGDISPKIQDQTGITIPDSSFDLDGTDLTYKKKDRHNAEKYKEHFVNRRVGDTGARVIKGREFKLLADMIDDGHLPFRARPVTGADFREPQVNFECTGKRQYQEDAYQQFLKLGAVGVYWMTGAGKSFFTMKSMDSVNGKKLLVVPTLTLVEQWQDYFREFAPRLLNEVQIITYNSHHKVADEEFGIVVFDECHRLPANSFSKMATLRTKFRIGLSASPYREDGRTNYIFALTGFPIGMDWKEMLQLLGKDFHAVNVWIVPTQLAKMNKIGELMTAEKTLIFCDGIEFGEKIADKFDLPFINGSSKARMETAREARQFVASRVLDLGTSIKDLRHVIEVDFLYGSRQQEVQRTGRLFHSNVGARHDIIMTAEEYESYGKRLNALVERGFKVNIHA